jgi:glutathione-regulated potassium-efflux system ancillary protein KefG
MSKVLLVVGHPDLSGSKANAALVDAVRDLAHVTVHDLYAAYPDFQIDADAEQALLAEHDVIVFQHPVYWYNTTPLFKQWQDKVLTYGWAFTLDGSASQLAGKKAVVAVHCRRPCRALHPPKARTRPHSRRSSAAGTRPCGCASSTSSQWSSCTAPPPASPTTT